MKLLILALIPLILSIGITPAFAAQHEIMSPYHQIKNGVTAEDVICKSGLALMIRQHGVPACVEEDSIQKLAETHAWGFVAPKMGKTHDDLESADLVLTNGKVYTVDDERSWQEAFAVKDGKLIKIGTNEDVQSFIGDSTEVIDAKGQLILPGFHDIHAHPGLVANRFAGACPLPQSGDSPSAQELLDAVDKCVKDSADKDWITGLGGPTPIFDDIHARNELDKLSPNKPLFIQDETGHNGWANSKAFELAGISKDTPDPPNSEFVKDEQGELHGKIIELAAIEMMWKVITPTSMDEKKETLSAIFDLYNSMGFVGMSANKVIFGHQAPFAELDKEGVATMHVKLYHWSVNYAGPDEIIWGDDILADLENYEFTNMDPMGAKIFVDGTFEGYTAATLEPYEGKPDEFGILTLSPEDYREIVFDLDAKGFQISSHAIGDKAVRTILDAYEELREERGDSMLRHRVTHGYLVDAEDRDRFAEIGVGYDADFNGAAPNDLAWNQNVMVGDERIQDLAPLGDIYRSGAIMGFGVDWPVQSPSPFPAIENAVTRTDDQFQERGVLGMNQEIPVEAAIEMFTINGAWLQNFDEITGSIEEGKNADFIIVDQNIFEIPVNEISDTIVLQTYFQGNNVYDFTASKQDNTHDKVVNEIEGAIDGEYIIQSSTNEKSQTEESSGKSVNVELEESVGLEGN